MTRELQAQVSILEAIQGDSRCTQRDMARKTGLPLSYINRILKDLVNKELVKAKDLSGRRFLYKLTPKGFTEKVNLTIHLLREIMGSYKDIRSRVSGLCSTLKQSGKTRLLICGVSSEAEIIYLAALETGLAIAGIVDSRIENDKWLGMPVSLIEAIPPSDTYDHVIVGDMERYKDLVSQLLTTGVSPGKISLCTGQHVKPVTGFEIVER